MLCHHAPAVAPDSENRCFLQFGYARQTLAACLIGAEGVVEVPVANTGCGGDAEDDDGGPG